MDTEVYQIATSVVFPDEDRTDSQRKLSGSGAMSIPASIYSRRSSRSSPLESPAQNYARRGSQASLNFHEISINTLHINPRRRKDSIPEDQYSNMGSFSFGTAETTPSRTLAGETDIDSLYQDDPERPAKRRATEGSRRSSQVTEINLRAPSPASVVSVRPLYNFRDEPDWEVSLPDPASMSASRRRSWMEDVDISNESRRGSQSSVGSRRKRKSCSADPLAPGGDAPRPSRTSTPTEARTPTQTTFSADTIGRMDVRSRRESRRLSAASSARIRRRSSSTGRSVRLDRPGSEADSHRRRSTDTAIQSWQAGSLAMTNGATLNPAAQSHEYAAAVDTWEGIDRDAILDVKPNSIKQFIRIGFHSFKRGEEFEDHLSVIGQTDDWAVMKDKTSDKWLSGVLGSYQVVRPGIEGNQPSKPESNAQQSKARYESIAPTAPKKDPSKDILLRRFPHVKTEQVALADIRIHHHAAVDGFSITRGLKPDHITHMDRAILLATKKSLRQYTNTKTTTLLQSHGLLDDNKDRKGKSKRHGMQGIVESPGAGSSSGDWSPSISRPSTADSVGGTSALSSTLTNTSDPSLSLTLGDLTTVTGDGPRQGGVSDAEPPASVPQASGGSSRRNFWTLFKPSSSSSPEGSRTDSKKSRAESQTPEERAAEKRRAEEFAKTFQGSFVQSGLLPRMPPKPRKPKNYPEPCKSLRIVGHDQYCMVLPLWGDGPRQKQRGHTHSRASTPEIPIQSRKFLLVYLIPIGAPPNHTPADPLEKPLPSHAYRHGFKVHGRILCHEQLSTSGIRLPIHGLVVKTSSAELLTPPTPIPEDDHEDPIMATITKKKSRSMVLLHSEPFIKFGLALPRDEPSDIFHDKVDLTELGWAVTEMIWSGCFGLLTFGT